MFQSIHIERLSVSEYQTDQWTMWQFQYCTCISFSIIMRLVKGLRRGTSTSVHCQPSSIIRSFGGVPPSERVLSPSCKPAPACFLLRFRHLSIDCLLAMQVVKGLGNGTSTSVHCQPTGSSAPHATLHHPKIWKAGHLLPVST